MRWCYGNARVFFDNASNILFKKGITVKQRAMILYITLGNLVAPFVFIMTIAGFSGWFLGDPKLFSLGDLVDMVVRFLITAGFLIIGTMTFYKNKLLKELPYLILTSLTIGLVLAVANSIAFFKAASRQQLSWFCTPKQANSKLV